MQVDVQEYYRQISTYVGVLKERSGVIAVLQYGSISAPGFSDIDLIVVTEDSIDSTLVWSPSVIVGSGRLFHHDPLFIPITLYQKLNYFGYYSSLKTLWSNGEDLGKLLQVEGEVLRDILMDNIYLKVQRLSSMKAPYLRSDYTNIYSSRHTIDICARVEKREISPSELLAYDELSDFRLRVSRGETVESIEVDKYAERAKKVYRDTINELSPHYSFLGSKKERFLYYPSTVVKKADIQLAEVSRGRFGIKVLKLNPTLFEYALYQREGLGAKKDNTRLNVRCQIRKEHESYLINNKLTGSERQIFSTHRIYYGNNMVKFYAKSIVLNLFNRFC